MSLFRGHLGGRHEKEKQEWAYHGALRNTAVHWNGPRVFTDVHSRDPTRPSYLGMEIIRRSPRAFDQTIPLNLPFLETREKDLRQIL